MLGDKRASGCGVLPIPSMRRDVAHAGNRLERGNPLVDVSIGVRDPARGRGRRSRTSSAVSGEVAALSPRQLFWRRFRADRVALVSAIFIILLILVAIFAPLVVKLLGLPGP